MRSGAPNFSIKGFLETSFVDWDSHISSVIFFGGCNFRCPYCHNRDLVLYPDRLEDVDFDHIIRSLRKYRKWVNRVVVTGGEPTVNPGLFRVLKILKREGLKTKLDTNGSHPERVKFLAQEGLIDFVSMDIKGPVDRYERWCGVHWDKDAILETVRFLQTYPIEYEFRMTFVPSLHTEEDVYEVALFLRGSKKFTIQGFRPVNTLDPSFMNIPPYPDEKLEDIRRKVNEILDS